MADNFTIVLTGVPDGMRQMWGWHKRLMSHFERVVIEYMLLIEAEAKRLAPYRYGRLRGSIHHRLIKELNSILAYVMSGVDYAIHQEFGTRYQSGKAHMRPAFEKYRDAFVRAVIQIIEKA